MERSSRKSGDCVQRYEVFSWHGQLVLVWPKYANTLTAVNNTQVEPFFSVSVTISHTRRKVATLCLTCHFHCQKATQTVAFGRSNPRLQNLNPMDPHGCFWHFLTVPAEIAIHSEWFGQALAARFDAGPRPFESLWCFSDLFSQFLRQSWQNVFLRLCARRLVKPHSWPSLRHPLLLSFHNVILERGNAVLRALHKQQFCSLAISVESDY